MMKNGHAYLKLRSVLIKKADLGAVLDKYDKIEILKNRNTFKDNSIIRIIPYVYIAFEDFSTILGMCTSCNIKNSFITGIASSKNTGIISYKNIIKLLELEKEFNINFSISNNIKKLICKELN